MQQSQQPTLRFEVLETKVKFRLVVDLDATPTFKSLKHNILNQLKKQLKYSHLGLSNFKISDPDGYQTQDRENISKFVKIKDPLKIQLSKKVISALKQVDQASSESNSVLSFKPQTIISPVDIQQKQSLELLSFGQDQKESIEVINIRIVNSNQPLYTVLLPIPQPLKSTTFTDLSNLLKKKYQFKSDINIMTFYDESGIPYYTSTGVMGFQNCEGICQNGRQLIAVVTKSDNDQVSHPKQLIDTNCTEIVKIKILQGRLQTKLTSDMIPVNPEKHTVKDLKCFISKAFNVPTYRIKRMQLDGGNIIDDHESSVGVQHQNDKKLLKNLNILHNTVVNVKIGYSHFQNSDFVWQKKGQRTIQPLYKQTSKGMIEFYASLFMLSSKKFQQQQMIALCGLIRQLSQNNAALVHAFYKHVVVRSHLFQTEKIALIQGLYSLFYNLLWKKDQIKKYIELNRNKIFEFSRGIFSALIKHIQNAEIPQKWKEREKFCEDSFTCQFNGNKSIQDLVGLKLPIVNDSGSNRYQQAILCQRKSAQEKIAQEISARREAPKIIEMPHMLIFLQLYYRLDKCDYFIRWQETYNPKIQKVSQLTQQFKLPFQLNELLDQTGFYIQQLKTQTAVSFQGYVTPPTLLQMSGNLMAYLGKMPCSLSEVEVFDFKRSLSTGINLQSLQQEQYQLDKAEEVKDQIMITRQPQQAIVVIFDASGSMNVAYQIIKTNESEQYTSRLTATQEFFKAFADRTMAYNFRHVISLIIFNNQIDVRCNFTECFLSFKLHINKIQPNHSTKLYDAILKACDMLNEISFKDYPGVVKRIVCLSDGEDNDSECKAIQAYQKLLTSHIVLDSFIVGQASRDLKCLTFASGGSCFFPKNVQQGVMLFESETVLKASIRAQTNRGIPLWTAHQGAELIQNQKLDQSNKDSSNVQVKKWKQIVEQLGEKEFTVKPKQMKRPKQLQQKPIFPKAMLIIASQHDPQQQKKTNITKLKRIFKEMYNLNRDPHPDARFYPSQSQPTFWNILIRGPVQTPYEGYVFHLYASFGQDYPHQPPQVRFLTPIYHCNINTDGRICHSIFDRNYSITVSMRDIINHIFALLMTPEPKDPLDNARAAEYFLSREVYNQKAKNQAKQYAFQEMGEAEAKLLGGALAQELSTQSSKCDEPRQYLCNLSGALMVDPVMLIKNQKIYEREVIQAYINKHRKVPNSQEPAKSQDLVPIDCLKKAINKYMKQKNWYLR